MARMCMLGDHPHLTLGVCADALTFAGALVLARDAFLRLSSLRAARLDRRFRDEFPRLNLTDKELREAQSAAIWTAVGCSLLAMGFLLQIVLRFAE